MSRLLLISPAFHGYWRSIAQAFTDLGYDVTAHPYDGGTKIERVRRKVRYQIPERLGLATDAQQRRCISERTASIVRGVRPDRLLVIKGDLLDKYVSPNAAKIPEKYRNADGYWTGVYVGVLGFCSNQTKLNSLGVPVPTSWNALLDPKLSKNIGTAHPSTSGTAFTTLWTQVTLNNGDQDKALDYMRKLHNNVLQYSKSGTAPGQAAGRGEVAVGLVFTHDCVKYKEAGMKDLVVSLPAEGTGYEIGGVGIVKGSKNLSAAQKYVDWSLTAEAQAIGVTVGSYQVPTNPDTPADSRMIKLADVKLVNYDFTAAAAAKKALTARFDAEIAAQPKE